MTKKLDNDTKNKALEAALTQIEKQFGKGSVMKFGDGVANMNVEAVPTGCLSLAELLLNLGKSCFKSFIFCIVI